MPEVSVSLKVKVESRWSVRAGGLESIDGVGGVTESILQVKRAGDWSVLPAWSMARTESECAPWERPVNEGDVLQAAYAAPSSEHWKVRFASAVRLSVPLTVKFAV